MSPARGLETLMERTAEAGKTTDQVCTPGNGSLNEVHVGGAHEVLGTSHLERMFTFNQAKGKLRSHEC